MLYLTVAIFSASVAAVAMHYYCEKDYGTWRRIWAELAKEQTRSAYRLGFRDGKRMPNCVDMKDWISNKGSK
jgi:hypothetical protein